MSEKLDSISNKTRSNPSEPPAISVFPPTNKSIKNKFFKFSKEELQSLGPNITVRTFFLSLPSH